MQFQTSVRRLVTRCSPENALAWRLQLSHALDGLDWSPPGLPQTAILCLRRLTGRLPGGPRIRAIPSRPACAWGSGFSKSLEQNARDAARPAREVVGADANAVYFADHAELLACLALDCCAGSAFTRWWWKALFPALDVAEAVRKAWVESPQHVPAALCRLEQARRSEQFLRAFSPSAAAQVLENVLSAFGLTELCPILITQRSWPAVSDGASAAAGTKAPAPWSRWVKVEPSLPSEQRHLLMVCAMLERAPGVLRSPGFTRALCAWHETTGNGIGSPGRGSDRTALEEKTAPQTSRTSDPGKDFPDAIQDNPGRSIDRAPLPASLQLDTSKTVPGDSMQFAGSNVPACAVPPTPVSSLPHSRDTLSEPLAETVTTDWGGVFYLVNVALALELYADFTVPLQAGLALPVWDFLSLVGRRMIGPEFKTDPLWAVLAKLSGRDENDPPGQWFEPPEEWRIPPAWLAPFVNHDDWRWSVSLGRLRLIHPQNFLVLEVELNSEPPIRQMEDELRQLGASSGKTPILDPSFCLTHSTDPRERWLDCLVPYLQARLERALIVEEGDTLRDLVFRGQARLEITASRVDVRFELAKHPIKLRLAGLDRDPGWVPAAGHIIAFHYD